MDDRFASLDCFLRTEPRDAGCTKTFDLLDLYVERELAHADADRCYPQLAAHLVSCEACREDFEGLLVAVGDIADRETVNEPRLAAEAVMDRDGIPARAPRADAARNLRLVIAAANELLAERGSLTSMNAVARRAGVGVGTIYRQFANKQALIEFLLFQQLAVLQEETERIAKSSPSDQAFFLALEGLITLLSSGSAWRVFQDQENDVNGISRLLARSIGPVLGHLLTQAQELGRVRGSLGTDDVMALLVGICAVGDEDRGPNAGRLLSIVIEGLRSDR